MKKSIDVIIIDNNAYEVVMSDGFKDKITGISLQVDDNSSFMYSPIKYFNDTINNINFYIKRTIYTTATILLILFSFASNAQVVKHVRVKFDSATSVMPGLLTPYMFGKIGTGGQTALVAGTKAITITGLTTSSKAQVTFVSVGGTVTTTWQYAAVCTTNTLTITALTNTGTTDTTDTSILNYSVTQ